MNNEEKFINDAAGASIEYFLANRHKMTREQQEKFLWRLVENVKDSLYFAIEEDLSTSLASKLKSKFLFLLGRLRK